GALAEREPPQRHLRLPPPPHEEEPRAPLRDAPPRHRAADRVGHLRGRPAVRPASASAVTDWLVAFGAGAGGGTAAFAPTTFKEILDAALRLGRAAGRMPEAMAVIGEGERRLRALHDRLGRRRDGSLDG